MSKPNEIKLEAQLTRDELVSHLHALADSFAAGRVVILDFGVVADVRADETEHNIVGSVQYMSPEQSVGLRVSAASDWYSMGVVLYEALTGLRPFPPGVAGQEARRVPPPSPKSVAQRPSAFIDESSPAETDRRPPGASRGESVVMLSTPAKALAP